MSLDSMFNIPLTNILCTNTKDGFKVWGSRETKTDTVFAACFGGGSVRDKAISIGRRGLWHRK